MTTDHDMYSDEAIAARQNRIIVLMESVRVLSIIVLVSVFLVLTVFGFAFYQDQRIQEVQGKLDDTIAQFGSTADDFNRSHARTQRILCERREESGLPPITDCEGR